MERIQHTSLFIAN